ncbi:MAG: isoleucine--tRNA ligase [Deltaproteobacteria bacterium GWC2_42_11]|nr:MAG: isoleucine--tRNA ligase [Deltaproteobacteria bacterium GWC2_42_11]HBO84889.1 isoleucine--tRNA ligase [Deltaproteobacteria bacterium]
MDYKTTLNLPKTDFPMKANLSKNEPEILKRWEENWLYNKILQAGKDREKYVLHDGPPYANGHIHIGHALNKILKDIIVKAKYMSGFATDYVPGWDCHGLPIELQVEKDSGAKKSTISKIEIRKKCRAYAEKFVNIQREEFKRLGVFGEWDNPYLTMNFSYQSAILRELGRCVEKGLVYKGKKPVHWCSSCQTALAEAEVEYADKKSPSVYVKFKVQDSRFKERFSNLADKDVSIIIWTTTPWTLPANLAIAMHPELEYALVEVRSLSQQALSRGQKSEVKGDETEVFIIAKGLLENVASKLGCIDYKILETFYPARLEGMKARHPFIDRDSVVILGTHVTLDAGTGCVHIAPGHGQDDYELGLKYELDIYNPVDNQGRFTKAVPEFEGQKVFDANKNIIELLKTKGALLKEETIEHSYPHCWRCKNPIIFRATEQWFISMENGGLRQKALAAIDKVNWIPSWGRDRIYNMVVNRPDWCISRQRAWGVPITAFDCKKCGYVLLDKGIINRVADEFEKHGADIWFEKDVQELLPDGVKCPKCSSADFEKEGNILDVWFDSGVSFAAVLEKRENLKIPADLYLEGSDQHRGWFHSALLASVGTRGDAPYGSVLTHGFVVDGSGKKMSKSLGNVIAPQEVIEKYGAEILRLWVAAEDYREDIRISDEILTRLSEAYRRIRNTCRFILGNLYDFNPEKDTVSYKELQEIDRLILHRLAKLNEKVLKAYADFEFHAIYHSLHNFCNVDLSAFYLDVIKDRLYTSKADSKSRRAAQTTTYYVLDYIVKLMAPVISFTSDEVWQFMPGKREESVHLSSFPVNKTEWLDDGLADRWEKLLTVKAEVSKALELARRDKVIGHSLDAWVKIFSAGELKDLLDRYASTLKGILIVSQLFLVDKTGDLDSSDVLFESQEIQGLKAGISKAMGKKCERCWNYSEQVGESREYPEICERCVEAMD